MKTKSKDCKFEADLVFYQDAICEKMIDLAKQKLLVIAPHPDDEVIGCAGLIKKVKDAGGKVYVLYVTVGDTLDFTKKGFSTGAERQKEIEAVAKFLKFDDYHLALAGNNYHLKLDVLGQKALMDIIERDSRVSVERTKPTMVTFPSPNSYNQDHRIVALSCHASLRTGSAKAKHLVKMILSFEEPADSWTIDNNTTINLFLPLTKTELEAKIKAVKLYKSQLRQHPNTRSPETIRALAVFRGAFCGSEYAEGFKSYRQVLE